MIPSVSASGLLTVTATSFWRPTAVADIDEGGPIQVSGVGSMVQVGAQVNDTSDARFTRVTSTHQIQLPGTGTYSISASSCCRVGGILNASESTWTMNSAIAYNGSASTPIQFNFGAVQSEVVRGADYNGSLGAVAGPGLTLSYNQNLNQSINSQPPGFVIDPNTGALFIPGSSAAVYGENGQNLGADYAFSGNILASNGSFVEFDWLFDAVQTGTGNLAPQVNDAIINVIQGNTASHTFTGTDPNGTPYAGHTENGFDVTPTAGAWFVAQAFGNPVPDVFAGPVGSPTLSSLLVQYIAQVLASDGSLTDVGQLTINVVSNGGGGTVPEPATLLLLGMGAAAAVARRQRKTRA